MATKNPITNKKINCTNCQDGSLAQKLAKEIRESNTQIQQQEKIPFDINEITIMTCGQCQKKL